MDVSDYTKKPAVQISVNNAGVSPYKTGRRRNGNGRSVTLLDVSRQTGLSTATVSRVLNNSSRVRPATREQVLGAVRELGYMTNHAARALARQQTDTIGVVFPSIASGFFSDVLKGIHDAAAARDMHLMVAFSPDTPGQQTLINDYLTGGRVDALILMNLGMPEDFVADAAHRGLPFVLIDRPVKGADVPTVRLDNQSGASAAMNHLIALGYRRIAVIQGPEGTLDAEERMIGVRRAAEAHGLTLDPQLLWPGQFTEESGYQATKNWLDRGLALPEAIFALNDPMAMGALDALRDRGLGAPDDVALVGFDDAEASRHLGLTTVRSPIQQMGRRACEAAIEMIHDGPSDTDLVLETSLIVRSSCGAHRRAAGRP